MDGVMKAPNSPTGQFNDFTVATKAGRQNMMIQRASNWCPIERENSCFFFENLHFLVSTLPFYCENLSVLSLLFWTDFFLGIFVFSGKFNLHDIPF